MASADRTYVDPSALRRQYVHDERSRAFCAWRARLGGALPITRHGRAELVNSVCLAEFRREVGQADARGILADLDADIEGGRLALVDVPWRRMLDQALRLTQTYTPTLGTRTLDVLHVASAQVLECRDFVTYDARQAALAEAVGLRVLRP